MGELELIERIRGRMRGRNAAVRVGIGDDCAVLRVPAGHEMVVTTDFCLEGRHFRRDWHTAEVAGHRCLVRGLSDVAAMGGRPVAAFLSLALPRGFEVDWVDGFLDGFGGLAERFGVELAGGDTSEGDVVLADVMVVGVVRTGKALRRMGARVGDGIYVTGTLGGAAVELLRLEAKAGRKGTRRLREGSQRGPEPRVEVGRKLLGVASACMDLSDGLSMDLPRLCAASGVGAAVESAFVPVGLGATLEQAFHGGEDYELLFTAAGKVPGRIAGVGITRIGTVVEGSAVAVDGEELARRGWEHFSG